MTRYELIFLQLATWWFHPGSRRNYASRDDFLEEVSQLAADIDAYFTSIAQPNVPSEPTEPSVGSDQSIVPE